MRPWRPLPYCGVEGESQAGRGEGTRETNGARESAAECIGHIFGNKKDGIREQIQAPLRKDGGVVACLSANLINPHDRLEVVPPGLVGVSQR